MIEEIDTAQFVQHHLAKAFQELGSSPEALLRAALEFVQRECAFLDAPARVGAVTRLAAEVAAASGALAPAAAPLDTPPAPPPAPPAPVAPAPAAAAPASPPPEAQPAAASDSADEEADADAEEGGSKGLRPNAGNGADLPTYRWTQTLAEVVVTIDVPPGTKGRACDVFISRDRLRAGVRGAAPVLDGALFAGVKPDDCCWNVLDGRVLELTLAKADGMQWWRAVVQGEPEIDSQKVEPESSRLGDLDPETRATVEKMMFDQRQKALGLPTSEEAQKAEALQRFMAAHPEMDFSGAKFM